MKPQTFRTSKLEKFIEKMEIRKSAIKAVEPNSIRVQELEDVIWQLKHDFKLDVDLEGQA